MNTREEIWETIKNEVAYLNGDACWAADLTRILKGEQK